MKVLNIFVDIDETICTKSPNNDYSKALPLKANIKRINKLYNSGHIITYWSARGTGTGINWRDVTIKQFENWGVKYHHLSLGEKPVFDLLIDDRVLNISQLDKLDKIIKLF